MKRTLILIANVGTPDNPAAGAKKDIEDYLHFFRSDYGGAWDDDEIIIFDNTPSTEVLVTWDILKECIEYNNDSDYFMIVFCGHGEGKVDGKTYLELSPGHECCLADLLNLLHDKKHTIIADSCRSVEQLREGGSILRRVYFSATEKGNPYRELCRKYYDLAIENASFRNGVTFYSASFNESAYDLGKRKGGLFSQTLLDTLKDKQQWLQQEVERQGLEFGFVTLTECSAAVSPKVSALSWEKQHTVIETKNGTDDLPFIICPNWQLQLSD